MALSNAQIERYSRQIIVPEVGGRAQERLLDSRLLIAGELSDIQPALAYMVGAGTGTILMHTPAEVAAASRVIAEMRTLNPDAKVTPATDLGEAAHAILILAGNAAALSAARTLSRTPRTATLIFARLDRPGKIAVMGEPPPCLACADADLLAPFGARADTAGFIAMVAAVEAFKILIGLKPPASMIVEFDRYRSETHQAKPAGNAKRCPCRASTETRRR
jgi:hypothetical protein